jgi:hypothetical protein
VDGQFDYRAVCDYVPTKAYRFLYPSQGRVSYVINVTNDVILEAPDEDFLVVAIQPGKLAVW